MFLFGNFSAKGKIISVTAVLIKRGNGERLGGNSDLGGGDVVGLKGRVAAVNASRDSIVELDQRNTERNYQGRY